MWCVDRDGYVPARFKATNIFSSWGDMVKECCLKSCVVLSSGGKVGSEKVCSVLVVGAILFLVSI